MASSNLPINKNASLALLRRLLELMQNPANANISLDLPGLNVDVDLSTSETGPLVPSPPPTSIRKILLSKLDEEVVIETSSGADITGTLIFVGADYVVLVEAITGSLVFVRIDRIVSVQETEF